MSSARLLTSLTLGIWLGLYALRSYIPSAVWNLSDELPLDFKPLLALGTEIVAVLGALAVIKWRRRTLRPLAVTFGAVTVARQIFITSDAIGPWLALISWPLWLWFMAALADEVAAHDADALMAPACALAIALQVGMQAAWHGLDLPTVSGWLPVAISSALAGVLVFNVFRIERPELMRPHTSLAWLLVGPALFLQVTLSGNLGRFGEITGMPLLAAAIVMQITLLLALIVAVRFTSFAMRLALIGLGFVALFALPGVRGNTSLIVLTVPLVIICGLRESAERRLRISAASAFTIGGLIYFLLIFAFYNAYELPPLWIVALAPLGAAAALSQRNGMWPPASLVTGFATATAIALVYLIPPPPALERDPAALTVMSYNIHHGFNDAGLPGMQRTANDIAGLNPDVVAIQEIGRGWTMLGGNDLVGYLRWRFPDYQVHFTGSNGQLWGNAIMSRLPIEAAGGDSFAGEPGIFKYGWAGAVLNLSGNRLWFYSVHVTADMEGPMGDARVAQVEELQHLVGATSPVIVAGDFNAHAEDPPMRIFSQSFTDLGAAAGLARKATWPALLPSERIDYIFGRGVTAFNGSIPGTTASDHLPVLLQVRLADTTSLQPSSSNRRLPTRSSR